MALLDWANGDLFSALRDKFNAVRVAVSSFAGGTAGQVFKKSSSTDFAGSWSNFGYNTTSTTANTVDVSGDKTFTVGSGLDFKTGTRARASKSSDATVYIEGDVVSYSGTTLVMKADVAQGSDFNVPTGSSVNSWIIGLGGASALINSIDYSVVAFTGGSAPTVSSASFNVCKLGGVCQVSFTIIYTGGSGSYSIVKLTPPLGFTPSQNAYGAALQSLVYNTPLTVYISGSDLYISPSDGGPGIQSGSNTITGSIAYPV
jgi:hypothetical protein